MKQLVPWIFFLASLSGGVLWLKLLAQPGKFRSSLLLGNDPKPVVGLADIMSCFVILILVGTATQSLVFKSTPGQLRQTAKDDREQQEVDQARPDKREVQENTSGQTASTQSNSTANDSSNPKITSSHSQGLEEKLAGEKQPELTGLWREELKKVVDSALGLLCIVGLLWFRYRQAGMATLCRFSWTDLRFTLIVGLLTLPLILRFHSILSQFIPYEHSTLNAWQLASDWGVRSLILLNTVLLVPILEELIFRGVMLSWIVKLVEAGNYSIKGLFWGGDERIGDPISATPTRISRGNWAAILISSLVFSLMHANQGAAPLSLLLFSFVLGYLYLRTKSLWSPIALHFILNGFTMLQQF